MSETPETATNQTDDDRKAKEATRQPKSASVKASGERGNVRLLMTAGGVSLFVSLAVALPFYTHFQSIKRDAASSFAYALTQDRQHLARGVTAADIRDQLVSAPEVLDDVFAAYQALSQEREAAESRLDEETAREMIEAPGAIALGADAETAEVTIIEFYDYNCPYCRSVASSVKQLTENYPGLRVILRDLPILSEGSIEMARAAHALAEQGLFEAFKWQAMETTGQADLATAFSIAEEIGADIQAMLKAMEDPAVTDAIQVNLDLADRHDIMGTPYFFIGQEAIPGAAPYESLAEAVEAAGATRTEP